MQPDIKAIVISGPQKERIGKILPYPGTWIHIEFEDGKNVFMIYTELLNYDPIKWVIKDIKNRRPPMEGEIAGKLFKLIRYLLPAIYRLSTMVALFISKSNVLVADRASSRRNSSRTWNPLKVFISWQEI